MHKTPKSVLALATVFSMNVGCVISAVSGKDRILAGHTVDVKVVAFSPDGKTLASAGYSVDTGNERTGEIKLWDVVSGRERTTIKGHNGVVFVTFSPDGKTLVTGGSHIINDKNEARVINELKLWDVIAGEERATFQGQPESVFSISFAFSPGGKLLALGSGDGVRVWDVASQAQSLFARGEAITVLAFSPDSKVLAAGSSRAGLHEPGKLPELWEVKLLDPATGKEMASFKGSGDEAHLVSLAFSSDGKILAGGNADGSILLWNLTTKKEKAILKQGNYAMRRINSVAFSPNGRILASCDGRGVIKLWNADTGQERASVKQEGEWINSLAFSPNGKTLASGSSAKTIRLWDVADILEHKQ